MKIVDINIGKVKYDMVISKGWIILWNWDKIRI